MPTPKTSLAAVSLLLLALTALAANALIVSVSAVTPPPVALEAPGLQDRGAPLPGTRCTRGKTDRCKRGGEENKAPEVRLTASEQKLVMGCREAESSPDCAPSASQQVQLQATATDPDGDALIYTYSATGGRVTGDGANVTWDLAGLRPGTYTVNVEVDDCCGCVAFSSAQVKVDACGGCVNALR